MPSANGWSPNCHWIVLRARTRSPKTRRPAQTRAVVHGLTHAHVRPLSRSCHCVGLSRAAWDTPPKVWMVRNAALLAALSLLVERHPSWGFWTCCTLLRKQHPHSNHKRIDWADNAMPSHRNRAARKRLPKRERIALSVPVRRNPVWSVDVMSAALDCGRRFRCQRD